MAVGSVGRQGAEDPLMQDSLAEALQQLTAIRRLERVETIVARGHRLRMSRASRYPPPHVRSGSRASDEREGPAASR